MKKQTAGRKLYSVREAYMIMYRAFRTMPFFIKAKKNGILQETFSERLMLAVTEVNQCAMCSYAHTKMALETGMNLEEINAMLSGDLSDVESEEMPAILFAQHYADSRCKPSEKSWNSVTAQYGSQKSIAILGAIRVIMFGNTYGIPFGSLKARFSKKSKKAVDPRSSLFYELAMLVTLLIFIPCTLIQALISAALHLPLISFKP
ncbi:MAG TPA: carboxymuconolactone decarboxylase family protein [Lachnospiraceae bacterium]|nr:carboxymuconolactone decarboxylase family protein [Lachnospiraceae bacterium]